MLEFVFTVLFCWLFFKAIGLSLRVTWCVTKIVATLLLVLACPIMAACLIFAGGILLLVPLVLIAVVLGLLKACT